jgi:succinate dehydrogenase / fumarate reductase cytochrome b subunit
MATFISSLQTTLKGYVSYRGREGHITFLVHRITGLGTLLFLFLHILDTSTVYFFPDLYDHAIALYQSTPFMLGEIVLVFCVVFHGVNGLRITWYDLFKPGAWNVGRQRKSVRATFIASVIIWLPAALWMGYKMLHHNFGMF